MPSRARVQELIRYVEEGREVEALREFYAPGAETFENQAAPTVGLPALIEKEERFLATLASRRASGASFVVDGDRAAINWVFEFTSSTGARTRMDEIAYQLWDGDKIVRERYYYDPASLRASA